VFGIHPDNTDYDQIGKMGGTPNVALSVAEMPSHVHSFDDAYYPEAGALGISGNIQLPYNVWGSKGTDSDNWNLWYYTHDSAAAGGGAAHENRPPYYVLAYIIRVK
jgi:microcystin-dependent protein